MPDPTITDWLARWYAASIGKEDQGTVADAFVAACNADADLKAAALARRLSPGSSVLQRDHISRVHNALLERIT